MKTAYVAGPLPFTHAGRIYQARVLAPALRLAGFRLTATWGAKAIEIAGRICFDAEEDRRYIWRGLLNGEWSRGKEAMDRADLVVGVLDGAPPDGRLRAEMEYAHTCGKRLICLSTDLRRSLANPEWREDRAEAIVKETGGAVVTSVAELVAAIKLLGQQPGARLEPHYGGRAKRSK